ncbi:MAG TPA: nucleotide sugar dehydrogenase [Gammaproteobacteria bacterium]|nr:nucleotide sugar dehydrogenase [Gammaproteobacteria bacterium]
MSAQQTLLKKLKHKSARIGIVGLGYVGLPLALRFSEAGFKVLGLDIDPDKVKALNAGKSYIAQIPADRIGKAVSKGFQASADFAVSKEADALIVCVPTPLGKHREPDVSFIADTMAALKPHLRAGQAVSLESTTYPGTTEELVVPVLEAAGLTPGKDCFVVYSPEREDPGNKNFHTQTIPKLVSGLTPACGEVALALYGGVIDRLVPVSSLRTAEMAKLLENIHRAINIGLVNEMKIVADRMGIDIHEVIDAAATKPFGFVPYYPGPGLGGHCIPIDPFYLTWKALEYGVDTRFIRLAGEVNSRMPEWVVDKTVAALNERGKALKGSRVLVLGIAYKKNVDDTRESPAVEIMHLLEQRGAEVAYSDPFVPKFPKMREYHFELESVILSAGVLADFDAVVLATDHDGFDYELIGRNAALLVDTRGRYRRPQENVVKA